MSQSSSDRNLLYGLLAWQNGLISENQLLSGMKAWSFNRTISLGEHLVKNGALTESLQSRLSRMVDDHIALFDGIPARSLGALSSVAEVAQKLKENVETEDVQQSIGHVNVSKPSDQTQTYGADQASRDLGRFQILREHATGGLGRVSIALDNELNRQVALKEIRPEFSQDTDCQDRFLLEAEVTGGLQHPGIVPVYALGSYEDGRPYYAMRFVAGDSLKRAIKDYHSKNSDNRSSTDQSSQGNRNLRFRELVQRFTDVCNAVSYAHERGVLHRDLKPDNIMMGKYGETLVVDWGLARAGNQPSSGEGKTHSDVSILKPRSGSGSAPSQMGQAMGTPAYMSPEQAAGRLDELGPETDVYSLGATFYELLTGRPPFERTDGPTSILKQVERGDFPTPRSVQPTVPKGLEAITLKAMRVNIADRYSSPQDMVKDIDRWLADEKIDVCQDTHLEAFQRWTRKHRTLATSLVVGLLTATLGLAGIGATFASNNKNLRDVNRELEAARNTAEEKTNEAVAAKNEAETQTKNAEQATRKAFRIVFTLDQVTSITDLMPDIGDYELNIPKGVSRPSIYRLLDLALGGRKITSRKTIDYFEPESDINRVVVPLTFANVSVEAIEDFTRGVLLLREKKSNEAYQPLMSASDRHQEVRIFAFAASLVAANVNDYPDAIRRARLLVKNYPDDAELVAHLANLIQINAYDLKDEKRLEAFAEARQLCLNAIELSPRSPVPRRMLAELGEEGSAEDREVAEKVLRELVEFDSDPETRRVLVSNLREQMKFSEALEANKPLLESGVGTPMDFLANAKILRANGQLDDAIKGFAKFEELRKTDPKLSNQMSHMNDWGVALIEKRQFDDALQKFEVTYESYGDHPIVLANLSKAHLGLQQFEKSVQYIEKARKESENDLGYVVDTLQVLICAGRFDTAATIVEQINHTPAEDFNRFDVLYAGLSQLIAIGNGTEMPVLPDAIKSLTEPISGTWDYLFLDRWAESLDDDKQAQANVVLKSLKHWVVIRQKD